jgi:hypothetical protein
MKRVARKGLVTAVVAGGVLASAGYAQADSAADGEAAGSPGVLSGNTVQVPVNIPVNVCGNTINVVGLLNPAMGNGCANTSATTGSSRPLDSRAASGSRRARHAGSPAVESGAGRTGGVIPGGPRLASSSQGGGAHALGRSAGSPGLLAGNTLGLPIHLPVNVSGNSADVVGIANPSFGNTAVNGGVPQPPVRATPPPPPAHQPIPAPPNNVADPAPPAPASQPPALAHTGTGGLGWTAAGSVGLLLGGALHHRPPVGAASARRGSTAGR